jgi:hypothetical protein
VKWGTIMKNSIGFKAVRQRGCQRFRPV